MPAVRWWCRVTAVRRRCPAAQELQAFITHGATTRRLREDEALEQLHRATTRTGAWPSLAVLAFDHRAQFEELAQRHGKPAEHIGHFKQLVMLAAERGYAAMGKQAPHATLPAAGVIVDGLYGSDVLAQVTGSGWWIGRPVERPGSRPLAFEDGSNVGLALRSWPAEQVVKCLLAHHPDDPAALQQQQLAQVRALAQACHATGHELLLELIPPRELGADALSVARGMAQVYAAGVRPDWWKLAAPDDASGWQAIGAVIHQHDVHCRGVLLLGLEASEERLRQGFEAAAGEPLCKGFAVGRSIFADAAAAWFAGTLDDDGVIDDVATRYQRLIALWCDSHPGETRHHPQERSA